jgi:hypothetical protein
MINYRLVTISQERRDKVFNEIQEYFHPASRTGYVLVEDDSFCQPVNSLDIILKRYEKIDPPQNILRHDEAVVIFKAAIYESKEGISADASETILEAIKSDPGIKAGIFCNENGFVDYLFLTGQELLLQSNTNGYAATGRWKYHRDCANGHHEVDFTTEEDALVATCRNCDIKISMHGDQPEIISEFIQQNTQGQLQFILEENKDDN